MISKKKICFLSSGSDFSISVLSSIKEFDFAKVESFLLKEIDSIEFDEYEYIILADDFSSASEFYAKYLRILQIPSIFISENPDSYIVTNDFVVINYPVTKNNLCSAIELAHLRIHGSNSLKPNKYFQKLIQNSTDLTLIIDDEGLISYVSPIIENILGFKRYEIIGDNIFSFILQRDKEKMIKIITGKKKIKNPIEFRFRTKNDEYLCLEANISNCMQDELIGGFVLNARDISDRKKVQESYKEEKSIFQSILQNAPDAFVLFDKKGEISFLNCAFTKITGFSKGEIKNINDWTKFALPQRLESENIFQALGRKNKHRTAKIKNREEIIVDIEYDIIELHNNDLLLTMKDITKFKHSQHELSNSLDMLTANKFVLENRNEQLAELNRKLVESERKLSELNISKDKFFSIIAHDLRSPFNSLLGMTNLVISEFDEFKKDEILRFLNDIKTSSQNIFRLLENLLSWAKLNSGMIDFNPEPVDLYEISSRVKSTLNYNAQYKKIDLLNNINKNQYVYADEKMLHSVFQNLLSNSIKFTQPGGEIEVESLKNGGDFYTIVVRDNGVGIKEKELENLFKIDVNSSTKGTANETGSGIGLILCKEFIEKNGGFIRVESKVGEGTIFKFTIPAYQKSE